VLGKAESAYGRTQELYDTSIGWRFVNPRMDEMHHTDALGETAENVARKYGVSREDQDAFALRSQQRWAAAHERGVFADEIVPVEVPQRKGDPVVVDTDEHPRPDTTLEALAKLRPAFAKDDRRDRHRGQLVGRQRRRRGAAARRGGAGRRSLGLTPIAFVGPSAAAGVDPAYMGIGPVPAVRKVLERAGLRWTTSARRAQRGLRGAVRRVRARARARRGHRQRQRGRDRDRAPARVQRRAARATLVHEMRRRGASGGSPRSASAWAGARDGLRAPEPGPASGHVRGSAFSKPDSRRRPARRSRSSVIGVESTPVQVLIITKPASNR
jgi:hypothetical protein